MSVDQASPQNADKAVELFSKGAVASAQLGLSGVPASLERPRPDTEDTHEDLEWWKRAIFYQIFPLSFQDSDGDGKGDLPAQARIAAMLLLTLPGTPFFYAGDEIGTPEICIPPDRVQDPFERLVPGYGLNRDPDRTPMHWDATAKAGFTHGEPWLPIGETIAECNIATQREDGRSILHLYRHLIALRRSEAALIAGVYEPQRTHGDVLCYRRRSEGDVITVLLNFGGSSEEISLPSDGEIILSTHLDRWRERAGPVIHVRPHEGILVRSPAG